MSERKLVVRTADQTRRADIQFEDSSTGAEVIQAAVDNWSLPGDMDYTLVNATTGQVLVPSQSLQRQVKDGDVLEVQPVLVAGGVAEVRPGLVAGGVVPIPGARSW
ncbi:MAG: hypothetical protein ABWZ78_05925 [Burkholderiaceae bacterium]